MIGIGDVVFTALISMVIGSKLSFVEEQYREIVAFLWILVVLLFASIQQFGGI